MRIFKHFFKSLEKLNCPFCNMELKSGTTKIIKNGALICHNCECEVSTNVPISNGHIAVRKMYNQDLIGLTFDESKITNIIIWLNFDIKSASHSTGYLNIVVDNGSEYSNIFADIRSKEAFYKAIDKTINKFHKKQVFK
jgi:hypothetical protein